MDLNREQEAAVTMAAWAADTPGSIVVLAGPAGTGKTTTEKTIIEEVGPDHVCLVAPTGRAALRSRQATGHDACTNHRLLYRPKEDPKTGEVTFHPKSENELRDELFGIDLILMDEVSMLTREVWLDFSAALSHLGISIMLCGDNFQLPPVRFDPNDKFTVFDPAQFPRDQTVELQQVFRQALDSPILRCATAIRESREWGASLTVIRRDLPLVKGDVDRHAAQLWKEDADGVVIAHRNATRLGLNGQIRKLCGFSGGLPQVDEPLLVRRNDYNLGVFNGEIVDFDGFIKEEGIVVGDPQETFMFTHVDGVRAAIHPDSVMGGQDPKPYAVKLLRRVDAERQAELAGRGDDPEYKPPTLPLLRANLGYVITCHASQGSEWDRVTVLFENSLGVMPDEDRCRWAYTGITRAKRLTEVAFI